MGNISEACRQIGLERRHVYRWLEHDEAFARAYHVAELESTERLEAEAYRRAHDGTDEPVYQGGELVGHVRKKSDTLLIFLLKARNPGKYRDRGSHDLNLNVNAPKRREEAFDYDGYAADFAGLFGGALLSGADPDQGAAEPVDPAHPDA